MDMLGQILATLLVTYFDDENPVEADADGVVRLGQDKTDQDITPTEKPVSKKKTFN